MIKHYTQPVLDGKAKAEKLLGRAMMRGHRCSPVGSRAVLYAARYRGPNKSDWDYLVDNKGFSYELKKNGFTEDSGSEVPDSQFTSLSYCGKDGSRINFICAHSTEFYDEFMGAQTICTAMKVKDKGDRIHVFETIRNGDLLDMDKLPSSYNAPF